MLIIPTIEIVMNSENLFRSESEMYSSAYLLEYVKENGGTKKILQDFLTAIEQGRLTWRDFWFGVPEQFTAAEMIKMFGNRQPAEMPVEA
jgi:hypothetical protein